MSFNKLASFAKDVSDLADQPALTPAQLKAQFDAAPNELLQYYNSLVDALKKTTSGDSGAENIGSANIPYVTGATVYAQLVFLKDWLLTKADANNVYTRAEIDNNKLPVKGSSTTLNLNAGASQDVTITYPLGRFTDTPILKYSLFNTDIDGAYTIASSIITNNKDGATIRVKNKGTTLQYVMIYYTAQ
jgi:hypothetical protein